MPVKCRCPVDYTDQESVSPSLGCADGVPPFPRGPKSVYTQAMAKLWCPAPLATGRPQQVRVTRSVAGTDIEESVVWRALYSRLQEGQNEDDGCRRVVQGGPN